MQLNWRAVAVAPVKYFMLWAYENRQVYVLFLPECPEQVHDNKTLYEQLQEQKQKKQDEWDEQHQLSMYTNQLCDNYGWNVFLTASPVNGTF